MGHIIKAAPDRDCYVDWSTIAEGPKFMGTRQEMLAYLSRADLPADGFPARLDQADVAGSSACWPTPEGPEHGWDDRVLLADQRLLERGDLEKYARLYLSGDYAAAERLTREIPIR